MDTYTLEAGRSVRRNGAPFVSIAGCARELPGYAPADFDTFARFVVAAVTALREIEADPFGPYDVVRARRALALLPKQEG